MSRRRARSSWAVVFGRFVAQLRIFAGPLAGVLRMPYRKFPVLAVLIGVTSMPVLKRKTNEAAPAPVTAGD